MASYLQRLYSLPVIRVSTSQTHSGALVTVSAVLNQQQRRTEVASVTLPLEAFGFRGEAEPDLHVPAEVVDLLAPRPGRTHHEWPGIDSEWEAWLHLVKPYNTLGAVPWERDLTAPLGRPIARLPDVLPSPTPRPPRERFHVAILIDAPRFSTRELRGLVEALAEGVGSLLRVTLLGVGGTARITRMLDSLSVDYDAIDLPSDAGGKSLLDLASTALAGRPLDAVHFGLRAISLGTQGALVCDSMKASSVMTVSDVSAFITRTGAGAASFTRPPGRWPDYGLRLVVDALGSTRAGPVLLHDPSLDPDPTALSAAFAVLTRPAATRLTPSPGLTVFLQPALLETDEQSAMKVTENTWVGPDETEPSSEPPVVRGTLSPATTDAGLDAPLPQWWAASQRFFEQRHTELARLEQASASRSLTEVERARFLGAKQGLADARAALERLADGEL